MFPVFVLRFSQTLPFITSIFPTTASRLGRTVITVYGGNFSDSSPLLCRFGEAKWSVANYIDQAHAVCDLPSFGSAMIVPVRVEQVGLASSEDVVMSSKMFSFLCLSIAGFSAVLSIVAFVLSLLFCRFGGTNWSVADYIAQAHAVFDLLSFGGTMRVPVRVEQAGLSPSDDKGVGCLGF